ncbi:MAG: GTPase Era [Eubacterium sp.]|nr:GTPase Era [Eubacterium sp.]
MSDTPTTRSGFAALIGRPNVGKSTLMNALIGQKIAAVSSRAQTTRRKIQTVYTDDRGQIVFLDTPGVTRAKNKLGDFMLETSRNAVAEVDLVLWLVEPSTFIGAGEQTILEKLKSTKVPVILAVNKIDTANQEQVEKSIETYKKEMDFAEIIPISAEKNENLARLLEVIFRLLPEGPLYFDPDTVTDERMRDIAAELIREQALKHLDKEIPHGIAVLVDRFSERPDGRLTDIDATIVCERESHKGIIIGKKGAMLRTIGTAARKEIEDMLEQQVNLKLFVKVRPNWRDNTMLLKEYGYNMKK